MGYWQVREAFSLLRPPLGVVGVQPLHQLGERDEFGVFAGTPTTSRRIIGGEDMQVLQGNIVEGQLIDGVWALLGAGRPLLLLLRFLLRHWRLRGLLARHRCRCWGWWCGRHLAARCRLPTWLTLHPRNGRARDS